MAFQLKNICNHLSESGERVLGFCDKELEREKYPFYIDEIDENQLADELEDLR